MSKTNIPRSLILAAIAPVVLAASSLATSTAAPSNGFYWSNNGQSVAVGAVFKSDIRLNTPQEIDTTHIVVTYPANLLDVVSLTPGAEPLDFGPLNDTGTAGTITLERFNVTGAPAGITGDNYIASVTFKAKAAGNALLKFENSTEADRGGVKVPESLNAASIAINAPAPQPTPPPPSSPSPSTNDNTDDNDSGPAPASSSQGQNQNSNSQQPVTSSSKSSSASTSSTAPAPSDDPSHVTIDSDGQPSADSTNTRQVTLVIYDSQNHPLKDAKVSIDNSTTATTNSRGEITIDGLVSGTHPIVVSYKGQSYPTQFKVSEDEPTKAQSQKLQIKLKKTGFVKSGAGFLSTGLVLSVFAAVFIWRFLYIRPSPMPVQAAAPDITPLLNTTPSPAPMINNVATPSTATPGSVIHPDGPVEPPNYNSHEDQRPL